MAGDRSEVSAFAVVLLVGVLAAGLARFAGYPPCMSDELNWAAIAGRVAAGDIWPISGPLHFQATSGLVETTEWPASTVLAVMGVVSVPVALAVVWWAYGLMGIAWRWPLFVVLATTSYFWAPLLESRPQQWGQALFLLGTAVLLRAMRAESSNAARWWLGWLLIAVLVCLVHLLSFLLLLLVAISAAVSAWLFDRRRTAHWRGPTVALVVGVTIILAPAGPYEAMVRDVSQNHLVWSLSRTALLFALAVVAAVVALSFVNWGLPTFSRKATDDGRTRVPGAYSGGWVTPLVLAGAASLLLAQAYLLPNAAWSPYGGSVGLFAAIQLGNLCLLVLIARGVGTLSSRQTAAFALKDHALLTLLTTLAIVLSVAGLWSSMILIDKNWFLRTLNYSVLLLAPVALLGLPRAMSVRSLQLLGTVLAVLSFTAAVRPAWLFSCP